MRCKGNSFASFGQWRWRDRVEDRAHDKFDAFPLEEIVGDAIEFAQAVVERAIEPLIDALDGLSREFRHDAPKRTEGSADTPGTPEAAP